MKINRKFLKQVQLSTFPRKSIQHIRKCYMEGGILQENNEVTETIYSKKQFKRYLKKWMLTPVIRTEMCVTNSSSSLSFEELRRQIIETSCYPIVPDNVWTLAFSIPMRPILVTKPDTCLNETPLIKPRTLPYCGVSNLAPFYPSYGVTT